MRSAPRQHADTPPDATRRHLGLAVVSAAVWVALPTRWARASELELTSFDLVHNDEGVLLSYGIDMELSRSVDDALSKAVPLFFVSEAEVFRHRFYWRDPRVAYAMRRWKIVFQPLTGSYRVTFDGGLSQNFASRAEAFAAITHAARWKIADNGQIEEDSKHYVEFSFLCFKFFFCFLFFCH